MREINKCNIRSNSSLNINNLYNFSKYKYINPGDVKWPYIFLIFWKEVHLQHIAWWSPLHALQQQGQNWWDPSRNAIPQGRSNIRCCVSDHRWCKVTHSTCPVFPRPALLSMMWPLFGISKSDTWYVSAKSLSVIKLITYSACDIL